MVKISAWMAVAFAVFLAIGEAVRNWGDWQWWPFWLVDYVAVVFLLWGAVAVFRNGDRVILCGAWGFVTAMSYMSFFSHIDQLRSQEHKTYAGGALSEATLTNIIGVMALVALAGLLLALFGKAGRFDINH